jgi:hypothetical protein
MKRYRVLAVLILTSAGILSNAQQPVPGSVTRTIQVYSGSPLRDSLSQLRERYQVAISFQEPIDACPCDLVDSAPVNQAPRSRLSKRRRPFHFAYTEVNGLPSEGIDGLLHRLASEYAQQDGTVFDVHSETVSGVKHWDVIATRARGSSGNLEDQPEILNTHISLPDDTKTLSQALHELVTQLSSKSGVQVVFGGSDSAVLGVPFQHSAETVPAKELIYQMFGKESMWKLYYDPEEDGGRYFLNFEHIKRPHEPTPLVPNPAPETQVRTSAPKPQNYDDMRRAMSPSEAAKLQAKLAQLGYYSGEPSGHWDRKTAEALKKFQAQSYLPPTGLPDAATRKKLEDPAAPSKQQ